MRPEGETKIKQKSVGVKKCSKTSSVTIPLRPGRRAVLQTKLNTLLDT